MASIGRLIPLTAGDPIENMSIDQALLESTSHGKVPALRFYRWSRPTLSLGYFQKFADRDTHAESGGLDWVRRSTGGGAIVHHHELTYSLFLPADRSTGHHRDLYTQVHGEVAASLREFGVTAVPYRMLSRSLLASTPAPFLCFQRRTDEDLVVSGYKILGSAQRKVRGAVLQHGSLLLKSSSYAPQLPGIAELTATLPPIQQLSEKLANRLANRLELDWQEDGLRDQELESAAKIAVAKFGSTQWKRRR
ncbi:MAG: biotin/lipoate A/B protein ligase family protein [Rubripirellula sp.]|nr:biotin/lipoate A/B protein ligase family protein [Rubripirellula sp.]